MVAVPPTSTSPGVGIVNVGEAKFGSSSLHAKNVVTITAIMPSDSNFFIELILRFFIISDFSDKGEHPMLHEAQSWFTKLLKKMKRILSDCYKRWNLYLMMSL